jgi:hypothetical protein
MEWKLHKTIWLIIPESLYASVLDIRGGDLTKIPPSCAKARCTAWKVEKGRRLLAFGGLFFLLR